MSLAKSDSPALSQLDSLQLPTLSPGVPHLMKSLSSDNIKFDELASIIEGFPSIAGKLIALVNSAWSAPVSDITSLEATCSRLGLAVVKSTSIALAIATPFNPIRCPAFDAERFWCDSLLTADAASRLATVSSVKNVEPSSARAAGLLHNLGLLWLVDKLPLEIDQAFVLANQNKATSLREILQQALGFDHAFAGGYLASRWELPKMLVDGISHYPELNYQGRHADLVNMVGLAKSLVSAISKEVSCPIQHIRLQSLGITEQAFVEVSKQLTPQLKKIRTLANFLC